ncbi:zinc finger protein 382-like [Hypomesus transpacificus]|uniref:zinc finger protein 382-like n=1 Tax=Hypomesus transpacificus TaxID=137520 RepID=UPI001F072109|nr:zinc finger protein 382-like [Hypomesus transpacificus]
MKPQLKTESRKEKFKSTEKSEVSLSFQDELAATIHGAFEVALEIAILEVTKLVGQALGDVRDQMHETLRENKSLKLRLQTAEEQLDTVRGSLDNGDGQPMQQFTLTVSKSAKRSQSPANINSGIQSPNDNDLKIQASLEVTVDETYDNLVAEKEISSEDHNGYFSEICVDGRVCSQDLHPTLNRDSGSQKDAFQGAKEETSSLCIQDQPRTGSTKDKGQDTAFVDIYDPSATDNVIQNHKVELVRVKVENKEAENSSSLLGSSSCHFDSVREAHFCPDSLSLVQSKMLEEWRPDALDMRSSDPQSPGTSHTLSHPPIAQQDAAELRDPTAGTLPAFSTQFPSLFQPEEPTGIPAPPQLYGVQPRTSPTSTSTQLPPNVHVCKTCGQVFQQPSELRRHYSQCQQRPHQQRSKPPQPSSSMRSRRKLQLYPPGRSPFHCTVCARDFNRMENLKTHLRIHTGERPYTCSVCAMPFRHSGALTRHFRIHTGEKPYVCSQCGKRFRNCGGLRFHQRSHGGGGGGGE